MKNNKMSKLVSLETVVATYKLLFKKDIDLYEAVDLAYWALKKLGNLSLKDKFVRLEVENFRALMPCDATQIHAVTDIIPLTNFGTFREDAYGFIIDGININDGDVIKSPESVTNTVNPQILVGIPYNIDQTNLSVIQGYKGKMVDYVWEGSYLKFNFEKGAVDVFYQGIYVDKKGWPIIPEMTVLAICHFINYTNLSAGMYNNEAVNPNAVQFAQQEMNKAFGQAIVSTGWTANEMDQVFNTLTNHTRKQFGVQLMGL